MHHIETQVLTQITCKFYLRNTFNLVLPVISDTFRSKDFGLISKINLKTRATAEVI